MGATALVGLATLRTVAPLVSPQDDRTAMIGERTRVALEREKMLTLRAIKELEFDRAMKKVSDDDFGEMSGRLRARAPRLMRQLDAGAGYRERIERDLAKRLGERRPTVGAVDGQGGRAARTDAALRSACAACSTSTTPTRGSAKRAGRL